MSFLKKFSIISFRNFKNLFGNVYFYIFLSIFLFFLFYFTKYEIFKTIGIVFLSTSIFKFLLTGNDFITTITNEIKNILLYDEKYIFNDLKLEKKEEIVNKLCIQVEQEKREKAIEKAKEFYNLKKEKNEWNKNFIVIESFRTDTIYLNGNLIASYRIMAEIMEDGDFNFNFNFRRDNLKLKMPSLKSFLDKNRFNDFSFNYKLLNYTSNYENQNKTVINYHLNKDTEAEKDFDFIVNGTKKGDIIDFMFSISIIGEYNNDYIKEMRNNKEKVPKNISKSLHAIRNITFQVEHYKCKYDNNSLPIKELDSIEPTLYIERINNKNFELITPTNIVEDVYYKRYMWKIYSSLEKVQKLTIEL